MNRVLTQNSGYSSSHCGNLRFLCQSLVFAGTVYLPFVLQEFTILSFFVFHLFTFYFGIELVFLLNSAHYLSLLLFILKVMLCNILVSLYEDACSLNLGR